LRIESDGSFRHFAIDSQSVESFINLEDLGLFAFEEGFSRPDWSAISAAIKQSSGAADLHGAWTEVGRQWAERVRSDLGGDYRVKESFRFFLLTDLEPGIARDILAFAERAAEAIRSRLGDAAWITGNGKHVIFIFSDEDDYYQYVSYFHRDGTHPTSGGCLISRGYCHIAMPHHPDHCRQTIAHELLHNYVAHLRLPLWLNEGLAQSCERAIAGNKRPLLDHDLREEHFEFWNPENIQEFWAGISFRKPGDSNKLSYSLAEILVGLMSEARGDWRAFVKAAEWRDAGQTASLEHLGADLGDVAATFLGEGDWRPNRKAIASLVEQSRKQ
jgi:hypothetical protein